MLWFQAAPDISLEGAGQTVLAKLTRLNGMSTLAIILWIVRNWKLEAGIKLHLKFLYCALNHISSFYFK